MHTGTLRKLFLALTFWLALRSSQLQAGDQTVSGNLSVTGTVDVSGNTLSAGTNTAGYPGWATLYTDGTTSTLEFDATRSANIWKWQQSGSTTLQLQMSLNLSNNNELVLYNQASTPVAKITLNPLGTSTFANSLTINGTDNEMSSQTLVNSHSVLTEGLADSRYLSSGASSLALFGSSATGTYSIALGHNNTVSGQYSFACGANAVASGVNAVAMGSSSATGPGALALQYSTASGNHAVAIGNGNLASGYSATALGVGTTSSGWMSMVMGAYTVASGGYSTAMGYASTSSGNYSTAIGNNVTAQAFNSIAMGKYNTGGGTATSWVTTDPLFEIGNGTSSTAKADALVVYKNGNAAVQGSLSVASLSTTGTISAAHVITTSTVTAGGAVTAPTFVTTAPAGDIPMYTGN